MGHVLDGVVPNVSFVATKDGKAQPRKTFIVVKDYIVWSGGIFGSILAHLKGWEIVEVSWSGCMLIYWRG